MPTLSATIAPTAAPVPLTLVTALSAAFLPAPLTTEALYLHAELTVYDTESGTRLQASSS